jgi:hypothetical protein
MEGEALRLPLWKSCLEDMISGGVTYSDTFDTAYFENSLRCDRATMEFGIAMSKIRAGLLEYGLYLSGRGGHGEQYTIVDPAANMKVMEQYQREAIVALRKGVILGTNTDMKLLTPDEQRRHEAVLERMAIRSALMGRKTNELRAIAGGVE